MTLRRLLSRNTQTKGNYKWRKLAQNCISQLTCPVLVGKKKYILFIGKHSDHYGIVMYAIKSNTYPASLTSAHPRNTKLYAPGMAFDIIKNYIYLFGGLNHPCFMIHNLTSKKWCTKVAQNTASEYKYKYNVRHVADGSRMILDGNQKLHVVGGHNSNAHMIFNNKKQAFEEQFVFQEFKSLSGFGLVSDPNNNRLILFGGYQGSCKWLNNVWFFDILTNSWTKSNLEMKYPLAKFGFVFLAGIQIILIFGGEQRGEKRTDIIFMLDLNTNSCIDITNAKCPKKSFFHALLVPDFHSLPNSNNIHIFDIRSKNHWSMSLEGILPYEYFQSFCNSKMWMGIDIELVNGKSIFCDNMRNLIENRNMTLDSLQLEEKEVIIHPNNAEAKEELNVEKKTKDENTGNINLAFQVHMGDDESLTMPEKGFKSYFYSVVKKSADKYYESFVVNEFNDLEIVIEFSRAEDKSESLEILCNDCGMNKMHARHLLRKLAQLSVSNNAFQEWFEIRGLPKFYQMMIDAGVVTFTMFEEKFVCCTDFVEYLGQENEKEGIFIWRNIPVKRIGDCARNIKQKVNAKANSEGEEEGRSMLFTTKY